jgi:ribosomal protein RSM22 (predicted rRNA methylase)
MAFALPAELRAGLDRVAQGHARAGLAERSTMISERYRAGGGSTLIRDRDDALAYVFARMPATYAAVAAGLAELVRLRPQHEPKSLLDVGAGPGTATWAAADVFPALSEFLQLDANAALRALARDLTDDVARFTALRQEAGDLRKSLAAAVDADLVIASYVIGELAEADRRAVTETLWRRTRDCLLVVEPGTPAGYQRIVALRAQLIAAGAHVVAPCPNDQACPLTMPDWCHFTQRLARSRDHMQVKGVTLPFEDEKFAYVALARTASASRPMARVLAQPVVSKVAVATKLCTADGRAEVTTTPRRDKAAYAQAKRRDWGDAIDPGT